MANRGKLQDEIAQTRPFRSESQEAVLGLFRTADMVRRRFGRLVEPFGLTLQQYNVLRILRGAGEEGLQTLTIGERMIEQTPGVTRLIDRLEAKGLVERRRKPGDRRCVICCISSEGLDVLAEIDPVLDEADDESLAMLHKEERRQLIDLLDRVREGYQ